MVNRGPYKRYEEHGSQHSVPRQTLHSCRIQERQRNENIEYSMIKSIEMLANHHQKIFRKMFQNMLKKEVESVSSIDTSLDQNSVIGSGENSGNSESSHEFEDLQADSSNEESDTEESDTNTNTDP
ncbi:hypothetical protein OUZ56_005611 [Daphnia magna]|uniref:Uncharacterized protein n=1 Tax=Daphnia magna TaxID=35525 RepID=A0ABQ9YTA3_9CRUS|nr:hypothetical protein OUZ56_005611 [Daphnia magna]